MAGRPRVLVSRHVYPEALPILEAAAAVDYRDAADGLGVEGLIARLQGCRGLVCQLTDPVPAAVFERCDSLQVVSSVSVGFDHIDLAAAAAADVVVTNTPGVLTEATADQTWALMLAAARRVVEGDRFVRAGRWQTWSIDLLCGVEMHREVLGIVGLGRIGQAVARRARGFGMEVLYTGRRRAPEAVERETGAAFVALAELLERSRFVTLHCPATPETRHLIDAAALRTMRADAILVNTARGSIVDEAALAQALAAGRIAGAALDVFEAEPAVHPDLLGRDDVVLAPHLGSATVATRTAMCMLAAEDCVRVLQGEPPRHPVPLEGR